MTNTHGYAGPIDALANYWVTKIAYADSGEAHALPECDLDYGASSALANYLDGRTLEWSAAFELGLEIARVVLQSPFDAETGNRAAIARAPETSKSEMK